MKNRGPGLLVKLKNGTKLHISWALLPEFLKSCDEQGGDCTDAFKRMREQIRSALQTQASAKAMKKTKSARPAKSACITYRRCSWLDTRADREKYGIQARPVGCDCRWLHCHENGKPLIFDTPVERDAKLKELRKKSRAKAKQEPRK